MSQLVLLILQLILLGFAASLLLITWKWAPYVPSNAKKFKQILEQLKIDQGEDFLDVGSGDGRIVRAASSYGLNSTGVEVNPYLVYFCRFINIFSRRKSTFLLKNVFKLDLHKYNVVYFYLLPNLIADLIKTPNILKPGTIVISYTFKIPGWKPVSTLGKYYIYKV